MWERGLCVRFANSASPRTFLQWFIDALHLENDKKTIYKSFSIKKEVHFENLVLSVIEMIHMWLVASVGNLKLLQSRRRFMRACNHPGTRSIYDNMTVLMHFLEVKQAVRQGNAPRLRRLRGGLLPVLMCMNHPHVSEQLIYASWQVINLHRRDCCTRTPVEPHSDACAAGPVH